VAPPEPHLTYPVIAGTLKAGKDALLTEQVVNTQAAGETCPVLSMSTGNGAYVSREFVSVTFVSSVWRSRVAW
jgi:hypothetical protein